MFEFVWGLISFLIACVWNLGLPIFTWVYICMLIPAIVLSIAGYATWSFAHNIGIPGFNRRIAEDKEFLDRLLKTSFIMCGVMTLIGIGGNFNDALPYPATITSKDAWYTLPGFHTPPSNVGNAFDRFLAVVLFYFSMFIIKIYHILGAIMQAIGIRTVWFTPHAYDDMVIGAAHFARIFDANLRMWPIIGFWIQWYTARYDNNDGVKVTCDLKEYRKWRAAGYGD